MGVNSHILPGDLVLTCDRRLAMFDVHPDEVYDDYARVNCLLNEGEKCLVISVVPAGSALGGHAFFVFVPNRSMFGWLRNYHVRPYITQREPYV